MTPRATAWTLFAVVRWTAFVLLVIIGIDDWAFRASVWVCFWLTWARLPWPLPTSTPAGARGGVPSPSRLPPEAGPVEAPGLRFLPRPLRRP